MAVLKVNVRNLTVLHEADPGLPQIGLQGTDDAVILVQRGPGHAFQCLNAAELKYHAVHITAEFIKAAPFLESKCGLPHIPEICLKHMGRFLEPVLDGQVVQLLLICHEKLQQRHAVCLVKAHGLHVQDIAVLVHQPGLCASRMGMVKIQDFLCHAAAGLAQGRDGAEQFPEVLICLFIEHAAAPAHKSLFRGSDPVIASAQDMHPLVDGNLLAREPAVPYQICGSCHGCQSPAHQVRLPVTVFTVIHHCFLDS